MKKNFAIFGSLAIVGVGVWYLFFKNKNVEELADQDPVGPINKEEHGLDHIRQVFHKAKELVPETGI
jgi:hypothetical protein